MRLIQGILFVVMGITLVVLFFKKKWVYSLDPFDELEYEEDLMNLLFDDVNQYDDPMEKLVKGMEHIYGPNWFDSDEVEQTPIQRRITSTLVTCIIHNCLRPTIKTEEEE